MSPRAETPTGQELEAFGALLRWLRGGESLRELSQAVSISKATLSRAERGKRLLDHNMTARLDQYFRLGGALVAERLRTLHGGPVYGPPSLTRYAQRMPIPVSAVGLGSPAHLTKFGNRARVEVRVSSDRIGVGIETRSGYPRPGDNYGGIAIVPILRPFDLSRYSDAALEYDAAVAGALPAKPCFEFKLGSTGVAHAGCLPVGRDQEVRLALSDYADEGVELDAVTEIVIAANSEEIGAGSRLVLTLRRVTWS